MFYNTFYIDEGVPQCGYCLLGWLSIEIALIDRPEMTPQGAGEPSHRTVPAAIANAIFDATGIRMRKVPITAQRMKEALARV